jgi:hypothetical protein
MKHDPAMQDEQDFGMDALSLAMLLMTSLTGSALLVLRKNVGDGPRPPAAIRRGVRPVHRHAVRSRSRAASTASSGRSASPKERHVLSFSAKQTQVKALRRPEPPEKARL